MNVARHLCFPHRYGGEPGFLVEGWYLVSIFPTGAGEDRAGRPQEGRGRTEIPGTSGKEIDHFPHRRGGGPYTRKTWGANVPRSRGGEPLISVGFVIEI